MNRMIQLLMLLVCVSAVSAGLNFEHRELDAGRMGPKDRHEFVFPFRWDGPGEMKILDVKRTCGCTVPSVSKKQFAPGESGELRVMFYATGFFGDIRKSVTLVTSSGSFPLTVRATVDSPIIPSATELYFKDVLPGKTYTSRITVRNMTQTSLVPGKPELVGGERRWTGVDLAVSPSVKANGDVELTFSLTIEKSTRMVRKVNLPVRIAFLDVPGGELEFKLVVTPGTAVTVTPASVFLRSNLPKGEVLQIVRIHARNGGRISNVRVTCFHCPLEFEVKQEDPGTAAILIRRAAGKSGQRVQGVLEVHYQLDGKTRQQNIPVSGSI